MRKKTSCVEEGWILLGQCREGVWLVRRVGYRSGAPAAVAVDGPAALAREEKHGDVAGFMHTHPGGPNAPSARDIATMRAWCGCFGKPLLCVIECPAGVLGFEFDGDESRGVPLAQVTVFPRGVLVGVAHEQAAARRKLSRRG
ncbi:MAG TPA: Mov34/MPN/PAD-1 family protein [Phycisphaerae bacterium]|jgi:hypothetical protein|nr:Mov34/MPN/PAD-1 family protein [Phycisphaerae bacterium]